MVENGTMPASSQQSPTSSVRTECPPHSSQVMTTSSIHGRCSSVRCSVPEMARSSRSSLDETTVMCPSSQK